MIKKGCILLIFLLVLTLPLFSAQNQSTVSVEQKARDCLNQKITNKTCALMDFEEKVYGALAIGKCLTELKNDGLDNKCWPKSNCDVISTSKTILALSANGQSTTEAEKWLFSQNATPTEINWFLQIESDKETKCTINYGGRDYTINIGEDKKISSSAGSCLSLSEGSWWLRVSRTCYGQEFKISCDESFLTSTIFQRTNSNTIYISDKLQDESGGGQITEKIESYCFKKGNSCDYVSSLWATMVLSSLDKDVSNYIPYLLVNYESSRGILAEAFLQHITGDYLENLWSKAKPAGYWDESRDRIFDTSIALSAISYSDERVEKSQKWLESQQGEDGCWKGIKDTGVVLAFVWPKIIQTTSPTTTLPSCTQAGFFCISRVDCPDGKLKENDYSCSSSLQKCCEVQGEEPKTCVEQEGVLCDSATQECSGKSEIYSYKDSSSSNLCCKGTCVAKKAPEKNACEEEGYFCRPSCWEDEEEDYLPCGNSYQVCCKEKEPKGNLTLIIVLGILIVLVVLGILFREKLFELMSKFKGGGSSPIIRPGGMPPRNLMHRPLPQRTILPPAGQKRPTGPMPSKPKSSSDVDDVLNKLKDIGK